MAAVAFSIDLVALTGQHVFGAIPTGGGLWHGPRLLTMDDRQILGNMSRGLSEGTERS